MSDHAEVASPSKPRVTIVVSPRERFGMARRSLESIYAASDIPFELVYIDGRSPKHLSDWLKVAAPAKGFKVIHLDRFVTPNEARNMGAAAAKMEFIVFIDNDVICADGWLSALVKAADETGADVVAPLVCEGVPLHSRIHQATGTFTNDKAAFFAAPKGQRELLDVMTHHKTQLDQVRDQLHRQETDTCEFHCVMVRRSLLDKTGPFDEDLHAIYDDAEIAGRIHRAGYRVVSRQSCLVDHFSAESPIRNAHRVVHDPYAPARDFGIFVSHS
ncbi:MAG: glycosyltransferase family 2 protein, partial [Rhizomicrobium sp.]